MMNIDKELLDANKQKHPEVYEGAYEKAIEEKVASSPYISMMMTNKQCTFPIYM